MSQIEPFHAPLLFYMNTNSTINLYCYFCSNHNTYHIYTIGLTLLHVFNIYHILNGKGYGMCLRVKFPWSIPGVPALAEMSTCFNVFTCHKNNLKGFNHSLLECPNTETLQLSTVQDILNIYIVPNILDFPLEQLNIVNWFMHAVILENVIGDYCKMSSF